jgi:hypothetical protein
MSRFNTPGPTPGSNRAISQRKAISEGYEAAKTPRVVRTGQEATETGKTHVPGLSSRKSR